MKIPLLFRKLLIRFFYRHNLKGGDYLVAIENNFDKINDYKKEIDNLTFKIHELLAINESLMRRLRKNME